MHRCIKIKAPNAGPYSNHDLVLARRARRVAAAVEWVCCKNAPTEGVIHQGESSSFAGAVTLMCQQGGESGRLAGGSCETRQVFCNQKTWSCCDGGPNQLMSMTEIHIIITFEISRKRAGPASSSM